jgi:hypothetical protein
MNFWKYVWVSIDASNPIDRFWTFIGGLFGMGLMILAILNLFGGFGYILGMLIGVIK